MKTHSSAIDPYNTILMDMNTKEGKYQLYIITKPEPGWSLLTVTVENADKIIDLCKYRTVQFGLNIIMKIQTAGTGDVDTTVLSIDSFTESVVH